VLICPLALSITTFTGARERGKAIGIFHRHRRRRRGNRPDPRRRPDRVPLLALVLVRQSRVRRGRPAGAVPLISNQPRNRGAALDVPGSLLAGGGLAGIVYDFSQAAAGGWASAQTVVLVTAGVAFLAAFTVVERIVARPLVPLGIVAAGPAAPPIWVQSSLGSA
jgi:hypothetical protein